MKNKQLSVNKSEILFLYESKYNIPNGDPFTGEQRYDDETKKILISDVRIKRYIRDYLENQGENIFVSNKTDEGLTDAKKMIKWLAQNNNPNNKLDVGELLKEQIDVRLFGGISTLGNDANKIKVDGKPMKNGHVQFTGPVQFALLNSSLNKVNLRMHQNTSHFKSDERKSQGSIGTTTVVPYAVNQIHGWVNPYSAQDTNLTQEDVSNMFEALWNSVNNINTRTKANQNSILMIEVVYKNPVDKVYGLDRMIKIKTDKKDEELRSRLDYSLDFRALLELSKFDKISKVNFYSEDDKIKKELVQHAKFNEVSQLWMAS